MITMMIIMAKMTDDDGNDQMYLLSGDTHPVAWDRKKITHNSRSTSDLLEHAMQFEVKNSCQIKIKVDDAMQSN